jgi:cell wall-associated NlpC family hydrolase
VVATLTAALSALNPARPAGIGNGTSQAIPAEYRVMMERASAVSCGVPWRVLAAIGKVESDFTPNAVGPDLPQFAGTPDEHALGLMQFLPSTYRDLAPRVDAATGKALGEAGIWDAESAIFAAALYLCDNGAPGDLRAALYAYNHTDWYVDQVLAQAASYGLGDTGNDAGAGPNGDVVTLARQYLGWPYVWGGADPATGFDCSGLVQWLYGQLGVALPRTAQAQFDGTARLAPEQLQPGDLVFFAQTYADAANWITHVGLYVGDGQMINAPTEGEVVQTMPVFTGFWGEHYAGGGRARR